LGAWISPSVSGDILPALQQAQFKSVRSQVPMLLSVAALNTIIIMAVCAHDGLPLDRYAWMSGLVLYCAVRVTFWMRRINKPVEPQQIPKLLRMNVGASLFMISGLGVAATYTFVAGTFASHLLIPMSLGFGATSIAHCLYTLRPAAIGTVVMGIFPSSIAMLVVGSFDAKMLGVAMLSVGILMIRFVAAQYDQLITSLHLEKQNHDLANTDALTGIANRRAVMEILGSPEVGANFGVALIDLDGFKSVNDNMGHHAGDALLQHVSQRLSCALDAGDRVGRLGGDEFIIIFKNLSGPEDISARSTAILAALCQPIDISGARVPVAASLGHALYLQDGDSIDALLLHADKALYVAKRSGKPQSIASLRHRAA
jgi:diguanylate cyclase